MSGIDGSILAQLEQLDPEEAQFLAEEIEAEGQEGVEVEDQVYSFDF